MKPHSGSASRPQPSAGAGRPAAGAGGRAALVALSLFAVLLGGEVALRALGFRPWQPATPQVSVEALAPPRSLQAAARLPGSDPQPAGRLYRAHPTLGYAPIPGRFSILFGTGHRFHVEHDAEGHRVSQPADAPPRSEREIWIFGGSFTYGWAIDDAESFPWRVQERMPERRVRNFGVPGYGTLHAWLELEERLSAQPAPAVVVVAYASFHDVRNTFARERRKRVAPYNRLGPLVQPYAWIDGDGNLVRAMADVEYRPWPGQRQSALVHLLETRWNQFERAQLREREVTLRILEALGQRARARGSRVLLATLTPDARAAEVRALAQTLGMATADLGIDLARPGYRNTPHDAHPSGRATAEYALLLESALRRTLAQPGAPAR